jgi:hypothetical protein
VRLRILAGAALVATFCLGCSHSAPGPSVTSTHGHPDLGAFLRLPAATPSSCPANVNGTTVGRRSPWVGTVDVSVFLRSGTTPAAVSALRATVTALPDVSAMYVESAAQAYAEFQRLYTCSAAVAPDAVHASLRLVLATLDLARRDALVTRLLRLPGVVSVSCDPSTPCVDVVRSATPSP